MEMDPIQFDRRSCGRVPRATRRFDARLEKNTCQSPA